MQVEVFYCATGPSLKMEDLDTLNQQGEYSIGVNRIYLAFDKTDWRPDYYVVCDVNCIQESVEEIKQIKEPIKFVSDLYPGFGKIMYRMIHIDIISIYRFHGMNCQIFVMI